MCLIRSFRLLTRAIASADRIVFLQKSGRPLCCRPHGYPPAVIRNRRSRPAAAAAGKPRRWVRNAVGSTRQSIVLTSGSRRECQSGSRVAARSCGRWLPCPHSRRHKPLVRAAGPRNPCRLRCSEPSVTDRIPCSPVGARFLGWLRCHLAHHARRRTELVVASVAVDCVRPADVQGLSEWRCGRCIVFQFCTSLAHRCCDPHNMRPTRITRRFSRSLATNSASVF